MPTKDHPNKNKSILKIRNALSLSQNALAEKIGISQTALWFVENGQRELGEKPAKRLIKLAKQNNIKCSLSYRLPNTACISS